MPTMSLKNKDTNSVTHQKIIEWVENIASLTQPDTIHWCDGSDKEAAHIYDLMLRNGTATQLNPNLRPNSYIVRSDPSDVARSEEKTFICSRRPEEAGPTNNWREPKAMHQHLQHLFAGAMHGRTMYVIPFSMGPMGSKMARMGVQVTDSPYVVAGMRIMTRMGAPALEYLADNRDFVACIHSVGCPLSEGQKDIPWPCNQQDKCIVHFPEERAIWSYGSGYGGNALLAKKCFALRIASHIARNEGWLAEHMLILKLTSPQNKAIYITAAFPSACGKTNLAMLEPSLNGWKVECIGDDIAWMHFGEDGRLYAINPEAGFFGVAPGTSMTSNPNAMRMLNSNCIFTNVATTENGDVWWEKMNAPPKKLTDWRGNTWTAKNESQAAHPNARFTVAATQCPALAKEWDDPRGVPISAILFGGRRATRTPLVCEALNWSHGVFLGSIVSSEKTAAAEGKTGSLRYDPMAMLPFCGYNMADHWAHWLHIGKRKGAQLPKIYAVNWFRKNKAGNFLWPGFSENSRVLKWIFERCTGQGGGHNTPIGTIPDPSNIDISGLNITEEIMQHLLKVDVDSWLHEEIPSIRQHYAQFGDDLPAELTSELSELQARLS